MVILPLAAVVVVLAVLGVSALARAASARPGGVLGGMALVIPAVAVVAVLAVLAMAVLAVGIGRDGGSTEGGGPSEAAVAPEDPGEETPEEAREEEPSSTAAPPVRPVMPDVLGPAVQLAPREIDEGAFPPPERVVDGLDDEVVLQVRASGFEPLSTGTARQCVRLATTSCGNAIAVQFDGAGRASFQYLVVSQLTDPAEAARCRAADPPCYLVVGDEGAVAEIRTVFGEELPPPGRLEVSPRRQLADGTVVTVTAEDFAPGQRVDVVLCAAPATSGPARCGAPGPAAELVVGPDGTGSTRLEVGAGPVGREGVQCGRDAVCGVAAITADGPAVPVVPVSFAAPPGADVDSGRLALGLGIAAVLVLVGLGLARRTDWSPLGEEAAPEIDEADYADLDAIVAALPAVEDVEDEADEADGAPSLL